jgi:hypothetical protein
MYLQLVSKFVCISNSDYRSQHDILVWFSLVAQEPDIEIQNK